MSNTYDLDDNELEIALEPRYASRYVVDDLCQRLAWEVQRRRRRERDVQLSQAYEDTLNKRGLWEEDDKGNLTHVGVHSSWIVPVAVAKAAYDRLHPTASVAQRTEPGASTSPVEGSNPSGCTDEHF